MKKNGALSKVILLALCIAAVGTFGWSSVAESQTLSARLFTNANNAVIQLGPTGPGQWCVQVEPVGNWQISDVDASTVILISNGTGSVSQIPNNNKTVIIGDTDGNGIPEARFCFGRADLENLFSNLHGNHAHTVGLSVSGRLITTGQYFAGQITMQVYPK
jgi:hypothetical protein